MPSIVLELLVGFVIGNTVLPFSRIEPLSGVTELGVLMPFFQVGMEVRGGLLGSRTMAVIRTALLSALTPLLAWWPLQQGFGLSVPTAPAVPGAAQRHRHGRDSAGAGPGRCPADPLDTPAGVSVLDDLPAIALRPCSRTCSYPSSSSAWVCDRRRHPAATFGLMDGVGAVGAAFSGWSHLSRGVAEWPTFQSSLDVQDPGRAPHEAGAIDDAERSTPLVAALKLATGLALLVGGSQLLVQGATSVALALGVSTTVIGSNLLNQLVIHGLCATVSGTRGLGVDPVMIQRNLPTMVLTTRLEGGSWCSFTAPIWWSSCCRTSLRAIPTNSACSCWWSLMPTVMVFFSWQVLAWREESRLP